jgi:hypothetical protein
MINTIERKFLERESERNNYRLNLQKECDDEENLGRKFVLDLLKLNYLNEKDRSLLFMYSTTHQYILFGGRLSVGISKNEDTMMSIYFAENGLETRMMVELNAL